MGVLILMIAGNVQSYDDCSTVWWTDCNCNSCSGCGNKINELQKYFDGYMWHYCYCDEVNLTSSISRSDTCINWKRDGVTLNCRGNEISGSNEGYGIFLNGASNNIVSGCRINGFDIGVNIYESRNNVIGGNNKISNNADGIIVFGAEGTIIRDNEISLNSGVGIGVSSSRGIPDVGFEGTSFDDCTDYDGDRVMDACDYDGDGTMDNLADMPWTTDNIKIDVPWYIDLFIDDIGDVDNMASIGTLIEGNTILSNDNDGVYISTGSIASAVIGNTIEKNGKHGVYLIIAFYNAIYDNSISSMGEYGVYLSDSHSNGIGDNDVGGNGKAGVYLYSSNGTVLSDNSITENSEEGIYLYRSHNNRVSGNSLSGNNKDEELVGGLGLEYMAGVRLDKSEGNVIESNTITDENLNGICLKQSNENTIDANTIQRSQKQGIYLYRSDSNSIVEQTLVGENSENGILLEQSRENSLKGNVVSGNEQNGIRLDRSDNNAIFKENNIENNAGNGIHLDNSDNNHIEDSSSVGNKKNGVYLMRSKNNQIVCMSSIDGNEENGVLIELGHGNVISINDIDDNWVNGIYLISSQGNQLEQNRVCNNGEYDIRQSTPGSSGNENQCGSVDNWNDEGVAGCTSSCGAAPAAKVMQEKSEALPLATGGANVPIGLATSPPSTGGIPPFELVGILAGILSIYLIIKIKNRS